MTERAVICRWMDTSLDIESAILRASVSKVRVWAISHGTPKAKFHMVLEMI